MHARSLDIYGGRDPRDVPSYSIREAARYLRMAPATLRSWVRGREYPRGEQKGYFKPLIQLPDPSSSQLSFWNLIEAYVISSLRTRHSVSMKAVRMALDFAEKEMDVDHLLLSPDLRTRAGDLFLDRYGQLINCSKSGQLAMKKILESYLERIEWDDEKLPLRLFPQYCRRHERKVVAIDPFISFGRPVVFSKGIPTLTIVNRIDAGETVEEVADDYDIEIWEVEEAIYYEEAA